jgi:hypothetical protein
MLAAQGQNPTPPPPPPPLGPPILDLFLDRASITVDLLIARPDSTDPATWTRPIWQGYTPEQIQPDILAAQTPEGQAQFRLTWPISLSADNLNHVWGVGLSYQGIGFFTWPIQPGQQPGLLRIDLFMGLVQTP